MKGFTAGILAVLPDGIRIQEVPHDAVDLRPHRHAEASLKPMTNAVGGATIAVIDVRARLNTTDGALHLGMAMDHTNGMATMLARTSGHRPHVRITVVDRVHPLGPNFVHVHPVIHHQLEMNEPDALLR